MKYTSQHPKHHLIFLTLLLCGIGLFTLFADKLFSSAEARSSTYLKDSISIVAVEAFSQTREAERYSNAEQQRYLMTSFPMRITLTSHEAKQQNFRIIALASDPKLEIKLSNFAYHPTSDLPLDAVQTYHDAVGIRPNEQKTINAYLTVKYQLDQDKRNIDALPYIPVLIDFVTDNCDALEQGTSCISAQENRSKYPKSNTHSMEFKLI